MSKVICFENDLGFVSVIVPVPELFNALSHTRWDLRKNGIDFSDGAAMMTWADNLMASVKEGEEPISFPTALQAYVASPEFTANQGMADNEILAWVAQKDVPKGKAFEIIEESGLPQDRYFRDAWVFNAGKAALQVDMEKGKVIQLNKIRQVRTPLMSLADVDFNKSLEKVMAKLVESMPNDTDVQDLKAKIQKRNDLRDATLVDLSKAQTPDELKNTIPDILK
jgi:hypothetical protein